MVQSPSFFDMNTSKQGQPCHPLRAGQSDSLLGMAASLLDVESFARTMLSESYSQVAGQLNLNQRPACPEDITSQVLAELSEDFFDTDDIFDNELEPLPLNQVGSNNMNYVNSNNAPSPQSEQRSRFSLLEDTLNQILRHEEYSNLHSPEASPSLPIGPIAPQITSAGPENKRVLETFDDFLPNKKQREQLPEEDANRFRPYQSEQWSEKFEELCQFKTQKGHCCVPHTYNENPSLARWVKRQRYQYKLKNEGKQSTMTDERVVLLENIGFIWDSHGAAWEDRLNELKEYRQANGHCNVPSNYPPNAQLATWVKCQRRQFKLFWEGKTSNMTLGRIAELEKLGFEWELRCSSKTGGKDKV